MPQKLCITVFLLCRLASASTTIYHNGQIHPLAEAGATASWLAVTDGKVAATGRGKYPRSPKPDALVNLNRKHVFPGLIDSHVHLEEIGAETFQVDLREAKSAQEAADLVREYLAGPGAATKGTIVGSGWDQADWPGKQFPHRRLLDSVSSTRPILLNRIDGHAAWVNTIALKEADLFDFPKDPEGGKVLLDEKGDPTGVLIDTAMDKLDELVKEPTEEEISTHLKIAVQSALSLGITGAHDAGVSPDQIEVIRKLLRSGAVRFRFNEMVMTEDEEELEDFLDAGIEVGSEGGQLTVRSVKLFADGAMGSRGAAFDDPYTDEPGNSGLMRMSPQDLEAEIREVDENGFQVAIHAIGDRANREVLDALEKVMGSRMAMMRPRLEHAQVLSPADIIRVGKLGVIASMQPIHCVSDMKWVVDRVGRARAQTAYAWNSLRTVGAYLAFGSDAPVDDLNPWHGIFAATRRQTSRFRPTGGFIPKQRLRVNDALRAYTSGASYAGFSEQVQGSLAKGQYADFIILPKDPLLAPSKALRATKVEATYVGGQKVWPPSPTSAVSGAAKARKKGKSE